MWWSARRAHLPVAPQHPLVGEGDPFVKTELGVAVHVKVVHHAVEITGGEVRGRQHQSTLHGQ